MDTDEKKLKDQIESLKELAQQIGAHFEPITKESIEIPFAYRCDVCQTGII